MDTPILVAVISATANIAVAAVTFFLTKRNSPQSCGLELKQLSPTTPCASAMLGAPCRGKSICPGEWTCMPPVLPSSCKALPHWFAGRFSGRSHPFALEVRPCCNCAPTANAVRDLPADSTVARICSFECTFCRDCAEGRLHGSCPNCGGELLARLRRSVASLAKFPAAAERVCKPAVCGMSVV